MARRTKPIARVRLARSLPRLLAAPILILLLAAGLAAAGLLPVGGAAGLAMAAGGGLLAVLAIIGAAGLLSVHVDVEESVVRVAWLFGRRVYLLTPGSLTRVHLRGEGASRLRPRFGLGWALGSATLREDEEIHVVRLAPTPSMILFPTARGRLAIATSDETHLIESLTRAAQARVRIEELVVQPAAIEVPTPAPAPEQALPQSVSELDPRLMTGIERSEHEERTERPTADQRATALPEAALAQPAQPASAAPTAPRRVFRRPSWARRRPSLPPMSVASMPTPVVTGRVRALPIGRPQPSWLVPLLPLVAAGAAWGAAVYLDRTPPAGTDTARLTVLALILTGPATTIGAIMARTWWPRIVGVVVLGGLAGAVFIGRAMLAA